MNGPSGLRFLRPYLYHDIVPVKPAAYARLFATTTSTTTEHNVGPNRLYVEKVKSAAEARAALSGEEYYMHRGHYEARVQKLQKADALHYPRMQKSPFQSTVRAFNDRFLNLKARETNKERFTLCGKKICLLTKSQIDFLVGRILSLRTHGTKLAFVDIMEDGHIVQAMFVFNDLASGVSLSEFQALVKRLRRGDCICE